MLKIILSLFSSARQTFQTRAALQAEILALRHQLLVLQRSSRGHRLRLNRADRFLWVWLARFWNGWRSALLILKPETVNAWHRKGFRLYWKWKSSNPVGRPSVSLGVIDLIHRMSLANPGWGAPRIHGELLKLGFELSQATVANDLIRRRRPPSQNWRTFLKNHMHSLVSADFFLVPTITFRLLFVFVILSHDRRRPSSSRCNCESHGGMDDPATAGSFPLGQCASLSTSRSRCVLRKGIPRSDRVAGHS